MKHGHRLRGFVGCHFLNRHRCLLWRRVSGFGVRHGPPAFWPDLRCCSKEEMSRERQAVSQSWLGSGPTRATSISNTDHRARISRGERQRLLHLNLPPEWVPVGRVSPDGGKETVWSIRDWRISRASRVPSVYT